MEDDRKQHDGIAGMRKRKIRWRENEIKRMENNRK